MTGQAGQFLGNPVRGQDKIGAARGNGALRHAGVFGSGLVLGEGDAAGLLNVLHALDAVRGGAREDHPDGPSPLVRRQRLEEVIHGMVDPPRLLPGREVQDPGCQAHDHFRGADIHVVRLDLLAVFDFDDRHPGHPGEDLGQQAVGPGRHVLNQHKGHPGIDGQVLQQPDEGLQTAGGGADPHYLRTRGRVAFFVRLAAGGSRLGDGGRG